MLSSPSINLFKNQYKEKSLLIYHLSVCLSIIYHSIIYLAIHLSINLSIIYVSPTSFYLELRSVTIIQTG